MLTQISNPSSSASGARYRMYPCVAIVGVSAVATLTWLGGEAERSVAGKGQKPPELTRPAGPEIFEPAVQKWISKQADDKLYRHVEPILIDTKLLQDPEKVGSRPFELSLYVLPKVEPFTWVVEKGKLQQEYDEQKLWTWVGHLKDVQSSTVTISCTEQGLVNGSIRTPKQNFQIRPGPSGKDPKQPRIHIAVLLRDEGLPTGQVIDPAESRSREAEDGKKKRP
jgi:hypothetical protein